ncbi:hypothetical protein HZH68_008061 [Vespula germanica]|uniref:Uncharacterized protein n=1 Tax=Vespula germanica TaxID=30212 RepID=A0A834N949_VESGE|nr:hypothetical protein HZH68_008061 [Vespula germanica]
MKDKQSPSKATRSTEIYVEFIKRDTVAFIGSGKAFCQALSSGAGDRGGRSTLNRKYAIRALIGNRSAIRIPANRLVLLAPAIDPLIKTFPTEIYERIAIERYRPTRPLSLASTLTFIPNLLKIFR